MSGASFTPDSILRVVDTLGFTLDAQHLRVHCDGIEHTLSPQALDVISAFVYPRSVRDVLARFKRELVSTQDWVNLTQTIHGLVRIGVLVHAANTPKLSTRGFGFDGATIHTQMLNDSGRTQAYLKAIRATVKPGDTVVDLGTGTGILATAAALAGASHVYAIEATGIADLAQRMFDANGIADRVTLVRGWSTRVSLPTRATVMVSELLGHDPFDEQILEATRDARKRFLEPNARVIPERLTLWLRLLTIPESMLSEYFFTRRNVQHWQRAYGMDFSPLLTAEAHDTERFMVRQRQTKSWSLLPDPVLLASVDLTSHDAVTADVSVDIDCPKGGTVNGVLVFPELELIDGISVSTDPETTAETCSWHPYVYRIPKPVTVAAGGRIRVHYRYRAPGKTLEVSAL